MKKKKILIKLFKMCLVILPTPSKKLLKAFLSSCLITFLMSHHSFSVLPTVKLWLLWQMFELLEAWQNKQHPKNCQPCLVVYTN